MTVIISGDTGVDTVGPNTVGNAQLIDGSVQLAKLGFTPPFTKYYETTVAWTAGSAQTITHALGVIPKLVIVEAVMKNAVYGLAIGDVVSNLAASQTGSSAWNAEIRKLTTTTIQTVIGSKGLLIFNSAAGDAGSYLTPAQADLRIKVFA